MKLTMQDVEDWRSHLRVVYGGERDNTDGINALCDLALAGLREGCKPTEDTTEKKENP